MNGEHIEDFDPFSFAGKARCQFISVQFEFISSSFRVQNAECRMQNANSIPAVVRIDSVFVRMKINFRLISSFDQLHLKA
jgi:hypothetical protein